VSLYAADDPLAASTDIGALTWYAAIAGRLDQRAAWDVARWWGGDASVTYAVDGRTCVRAAIAADTEQHLVQMGEVLQAWIDAVPAASGTLVVEPATLTVSTCDPGADGPSAPAELPEVLGVLWEISLGFLNGSDADAPQPFRTCMADEAVATFSLDEIAALSTEELSEEQITQLAEACAPSVD
jgi:hypothetical protein